jgi:hypothetical protein
MLGFWVFKENHGTEVGRAQLEKIAAEYNEIEGPSDLWREATTRVYSRKHGHYSLSIRRHFMLIFSA